MKRTFFFVVASIVSILPARADEPPRYEGKTAEEWMSQLADGDTFARRQAAAMLGWMDRDAKPAIAVLTTALTDKDARVRSTAAYALGRIGPDAKSAASGLVELVKNDEPSVRVCGATALRRIRAPAHMAIPPLVSMLRHGLDHERDVAAEVLALYGPAALPTLIDLVRIKNPDERLAMETVVRICPEEAAEVRKLTGMVYITKPADAEWRRGMPVKELVRLESVPTTTDVVRMEKPARRAALAALGRMGAEAQPAVPTLVELARVVGPEQCAAIAALREIGPAANSALPALREIAASGKAAAGAAEYAIDWIDPERLRLRVFQDRCGPPCMQPLPPRVWDDRDGCGCFEPYPQPPVQPATMRPATVPRPPRR